MAKKPSGNPFAGKDAPQKAKGMPGFAFKGVPASKSGTKAQGKRGKRGC